MKVRIDGMIYKGSGTAIMDDLRQQAFAPEKYPDTDSYIRQMRENFIRATDMDCPLAAGSVEERARAMFSFLAGVGALEILDNE